MLATRNKHIKFILLNLLGEAPMQTQAIAQKCRKTPMGRTGIVGLRLFLRQLSNEFSLLYVVQCQSSTRGKKALFSHAILNPSSYILGGFLRKKTGSKRQNLPKQKSYLVINENKILFISKCNIMFCFKSGGY